MGGIGFLLPPVRVRVYVVVLILLLLDLHIHCGAAEVEANNSMVADHNKFECENASEGFIHNYESDNVSEGFVGNYETDNLPDSLLPGVGAVSSFQLGDMLDRLKNAFKVLWRILMKPPHFLIEISYFLFLLWQLVDKIRYRNINLIVPSANELEMQKIENIFRLADDQQSFHFPLNPRRLLSPDGAREFNYGWRLAVGNHCTGLPICSLITALHKRYGIMSQSLNQPWPAQKLLNFKYKVVIEEQQTSNSSRIYLDCLITEYILARLPLPSLMRMKCVSKTWHNAICTSPSFWSLHNSLNSNYLVVQHTTQGSHGIILFSPSLNHWFRIPLPLPWRKHSISQLTPPSLVHLCAVGGGLFLFVDWECGKISNPVVINPLTKQYMVLPDFPFHQDWQDELAFELSADLSSNHFNVIVISSTIREPSKVCPLIYNSSLNIWTRGHVSGARPWRSPEHPWWRTTAHPWRSTLHEGLIYCTSTYGVHVGCYDIQSTEFKYLDTDEGLPRLIDFLDSDGNPHATLPSLVVCGEKIILVARLRNPETFFGRLPVIKHSLVGIWELDLSSNSRSWSLISGSPQDLLEATVESSDGTDFLVASDGRDGIWFMLRGSMKLLSFNLSSVEWNLLPGYPGEDIMDNSARKAFSTIVRMSPHC